METNVNAGTLLYRVVRGQAGTTLMLHVDVKTYIYAATPSMLGLYNQTGNAAPSPLGSLPALYTCRPSSI